MLQQKQYEHQRNLAVNGGLWQPAGHGAQCTEGRMISGRRQDEMDVSRQGTWKPVQSVGTVFKAQLVQSIK